MLWASCQIHKIAGCACTGYAGNVFPTTDFKGNRQLAIPACITARTWRTRHDACRDRQLAVEGKRSRHSWRMRNPQFYVSGKRSIKWRLWCIKLMEMMYKLLWSCWCGLDGFCTIQYHFDTVKVDVVAVQWRHNGHDSVSSHEPRDCFINL